MSAKTWKQLKPEGETRCCATFKDGTQCRRRVSRENVAKYDYFCNKHLPLMKAWEKFNLELIEVGKGKRRVR
jgi:hypothetical protein